MSTRPASNDPADVAAWEEERARLREEKEFREDMRASAADTKVRLEWLSQTMQAHDKRDEERFSAMQEQHEELAKKVRGHTQIVMRGRDNWKVFYAVCGALVVILGAVATLWTLIKGG